MTKKYLRKHSKCQDDRCRRCGIPIKYKPANKNRSGTVCLNCSYYYRGERRRKIRPHEKAFNLLDSNGKWRELRGSD